jgi:hypothetical protein
MLFTRKPGEDENGNKFNVGTDNDGVPDKYDPRLD